ncbi:MAG: efflux RND transporter periplasmic adaptor subunit [Acidobacteriota bacterium]
MKRIAIAGVLLVCGGLAAACSRDTARQASQGTSNPAQAGQARPADVPPAVGAIRGRGGRGPGQGQGRPRRWERGRATASITLTPAEREHAGLQVVRAVRGEVRSELRAMGKLVAPQSRMAVVGYPFPARIAAVHVQVGDWVRPGSLLVTLQSEAVGTAKADFYTALADHELARQAFDREATLLKGGVGAQKAYQTSEAALKVAEARLEAAEKKLHVLGFTEGQVAQTRASHEISPVITLHAPIAGKVTTSQAVLGAAVDQGTEILTLIDPTVLWVDAEIYERDLARVRPGQVVNVSVPAYPGEVFAGRVGYIGDIVKPETQTITVRADVANRDGRLKPGMFASVNFVLAERARALLIPDSAVLDDDGEAMAFVADGERYVPRAIQLGARTNGHWEVLSGVAEGEQVVTRGGFQLRSKLFDAVLRQDIH